MDTTAKQPLVGATVTVIFTRDSAMATYTQSDKTGVFEIKDLANESYKLHITFKGLESYQKTFSITPAR